MEKLCVLVSSGKDSVALMDIVVRSGVPATFVTKYLVPDLEMDEVVLQAQEKRYGIKIHRVAAPRRAAMFAHDVLRIEHIWEAGEGATGAHSKKFDKFLVSLSGTPWLATGIRKTDNPTRAIALSKYPNPHPKNCRVYPLAEWRKGEVWEYIRQRDLPVSPAYRLFGRSLDCLNIKHVYPLKAGIPGDYAKIVKDFPLIEPLMWVYEKRVRQYGTRNLPEC